MLLKITIEIWKEGKWFLAKTPELDFVSQGRTIEEAKKNLLEVIKIQFEEMKEMGTLEKYLTEMGFEIKDDIITYEAELIGFDKSEVLV